MTKITKYSLVLSTLVVIFYDVIAYVYGEDGATISEVVLSWSDSSALPFAFGALGGHLFWPDRKWRPAKQKFAGLGVLLSVAGVITQLPAVHPLLGLLLGVFGGHLLWPQTPNP